MIKLGSHPLQESRKVSASYLKPGEIFFDDDYYRVISTHRKQDCIEITCRDRKGRVQTISYDLVGYDRFCVLEETDFSWNCSCTAVDPHDNSQFYHEVIIGFDKDEATDRFLVNTKHRYPTRKGWRIRDVKVVTGPMMLRR